MKYKEKLIYVNAVQMCISSLPIWPRRKKCLNLMSNFPSSPDISLRRLAVGKYKKAFLVVAADDAPAQWTKILTHFYLRACAEFCHELIKCGTSV